MIRNLFKHSVAWRLHTVVVLMSGLCGLVYYYKNRDGIVYDDLLINLTLANALPQKVSSPIGEVPPYLRAHSIENEALISVSLANLHKLANPVHTGTPKEHEESLFIADGLKQIIVNLESTTFEAIQLIGDKQPSIKRVENIDLLNILIDVVQKNAYRFVATVRAINNRDMPWCYMKQHRVFCHCNRQSLNTPCCRFGNMGALVNDALGYEQRLGCRQAKK